MTTKEVAQICGVTDRTVSGNAQKAGVVLENGKTHDWTEEEVKRLQLVLMKNSVYAGGQKTEESIVKENLESTFEVGLVEQKLQAKQLEVQNQLLLEQKEQAEAETARIYQCNRNFHSHLYTASDISKKLGITPNMVGRIANENGLKQDPIYGKLGKIQLDNGKWVNQFYYNEDALTVIESVIG